MNRITDPMLIGTVGELLVQLRFLEHGVQAAPPIKDSGNDLIAISNNSFRAIQVKTTERDVFDRPRADRQYHILAVVHLIADENTIHLDTSSVFLIPRDQVETISTRIKDLDAYRMSRDYVRHLFE